MTTTTEALNYFELVEAVANYYGKGSQQWNAIIEKGVNAENAYKILRQVPGLQLTTSKSGKVLSVSKASTISKTTQLAESLGASSTSTINIPITAETGSSILKAGSVTKAGTMVTSIVGSIGLNAATTGVGYLLGYGIENAFYKSNPEYWESLGLSKPGSFGHWLSNYDNTIGLGDALLQHYIFKDENGKIHDKSYIDSTIVADVAFKLLKEQGWSTAKSNLITPTEAQELGLEVDYPVRYNSSNIKMILQSPTTKDFAYETAPYPTTLDVHLEDGTNSSDVRYSFLMDEQNRIQYLLIATTLNIDNIKVNLWDQQITSALDGNIEHNGIPVKFVTIPFGLEGIGEYEDLTKIGKPNTYTKFAFNIFSSIAWIIGTQGLNEGGTLPAGVTGDGDGFDYSSVTTPDEMLDELLKNHPDWNDNSIVQNVPQPDGTTDEIQYIPFPLPNINPTPTTIPNNDYELIVDPEIKPDPDTIPDGVTSTIETPPTDDDVPIGNETPAITPSTSSVSALYSVYNPTLTNINNFGKWLWSSDFVDQLLKVFSDPMEAIISLHRVYCTPNTGNETTIKVGYLDSKVTSKVVNNQYTSISCGSVNIKPVYSNAADYTEEINLYLPFIGIVELDASEVMNSVLTVDYKIDVTTGICIANVTVNKQGSSYVAYTYNGNCAEQLPFSSGSYFSSILGGVSGAITGLSVGGPAGAVGAGLMGALKGGSTVQKSGSLSGNAGAMNIKKPYVIRHRKLLSSVGDINKLYNPINSGLYIRDCHGYTEATKVIITSSTATDQEIQEIEDILKSGFIA